MSAINYKTRTSDSEALTVSGAGCGVGHLDLAQGESAMRAGTHLNALKNSYACTHLCARSVEMGAQ